MKENLIDENDDFNKTLIEKHIHERMKGTPFDEISKNAIQPCLKFAVKAYEIIQNRVEYDKETCNVRAEIFIGCMQTILFKVNFYLIIVSFK